MRGRPTLVQNAETLAHIALIARHGPQWFRGLGTGQHPGSTLISVSGAVTAPGVYEIEHGMELSELMRWVGGGAHVGATSSAGTSAPGWTPEPPAAPGCARMD